MPRPRLYAGADQPARLSLEIDSIEHQGELVPVLSRDVLQMPFCALTRLARSDGTHLPKVLVVAPLSGHFPILLRDLVIGLLPSFQVFITDWVNARHVALDQGPFDLEKNVVLHRRDDGAFGSRTERHGFVPSRPAGSGRHRASRGDERASRPAYACADSSAGRSVRQSDPRRAPDPGATAVLVRAQRDYSGAAPLSGSGPPRLSRLGAASGPVGSPGPPRRRGRRTPRENAPRRWQRSPAVPLPRSLFDADGPSRGGLPGHHSPYLPGALRLEGQADRPRSAQWISRRSGRPLS